MESLAARSLTFSYPGSAVSALRDVTFSVQAGEFVTIFGPSGSGKTTLLRQFKPALAPHGERSGELLLFGRPLDRLDAREQSARIGFVAQSPEHQLVTDRVWHELAFGLENLGLPTQDIRRRVAETAAFFGMEPLFHKQVNELSSGQKQLLNLAATLVMQPEVLLLDEPTALLDPIAASALMSVLGKINRELGLTVVLTEHRLEEAFALSHRVICMEQGSVMFEGSPSDAGRALREGRHTLFAAMPVPMRIWAEVPSALPCPITVREGRLWLDTLPVPEIPPQTPHQAATGTEVLAASDLWFSYDGKANGPLKGLSLSLEQGELLCLLGGNGSGKSTLLTLLAGASTPQAGKITLFGRPLAAIPPARLAGSDGRQALIGLLPQNPQTLFCGGSLRHTLLSLPCVDGMPQEDRESLACRIARLCGIERLLEVNPADLSYGEQQIAGLAVVLMQRPSVLLLDEPTKGLDAAAKSSLARLLHALCRQGVSILAVSHDVEFCAEHADRCTLLFDGQLIVNGSPREFFAGNSFYTTAASRMARNRIPQAVTVRQVVEALGGTPEEDTPCAALLDPIVPSIWEGEHPMLGEPQNAMKLPLAQRLKAMPTSAKCKLLLVGAVLVLTVGLLWAGPSRVALLIGGENFSLSDSANRWLTVTLLASICLQGDLIASLAGAGSGQQTQANTRRRGAGRTALVMLSVVALTVTLGTLLLGDRKVFLISMLVVFEAMFPFFLSFERRKPDARVLALAAVLCAVAVAGRLAFFMLPQVKPTIAIIILAGVAFGGEFGFLVGALTALVSNLFFGQGPWTPWQMLAFGMVGMLAGVLFTKGRIKPGRVQLSIFGLLAVLLPFGFVLDISSVLTYQAYPTWEMFALACLQGMPFNLVHAAATFAFLWLTSRPMLEVLQRVKQKYGITEL